MNLTDNFIKESRDISAMVAHTNAVRLLEQMEITRFWPLRADLKLTSRQIYLYVQKYYIPNKHESYRYEP